MIKVAQTATKFVLFTGSTKPTMQPEGTVGDHWIWEVHESGGGSVTTQTSVPEVALQMTPGDYNVTLQLKDSNGAGIGDKVSLDMTVPGDSGGGNEVEVHTASAITYTVI